MIFVAVFYNSECSNDILDDVGPGKTRIGSSRYRVGTWVEDPFHHALFHVFRHTVAQAIGSLLLC